MSELMEEEIKRWTALRKVALVLEITQGKAAWPRPTASCQFAGPTRCEMREKQSGLAVRS